MSRVATNIAANFSGKLVLAALNIAMPPFYVRILGIESYGLVGFFATLQALLAVLDLGLGAAFGRNLAQLSSAPETNAQSMRDSARTYSFLFWGIGALLALSVFGLAPLISGRWLGGNSLGQGRITVAIQLMACVIALRWPAAIYASGLNSLQRQVSLNVLQVSAGVMRALGALVILKAFSPTIEAFFAWQIVTTGLEVVVNGFLLGRALPLSPRGPRFQKDILAAHWRFSAAVTGVAILSALVYQVDKIVLSRMVPLRDFGYYTLASAISNGLMYLVSPVYSAAYPRLCQLSLGTEARSELVQLYHKSCQLVSCLVIPPAIALIAFSRTVVFVWTGDWVIADRTHEILALLTLGSAFNALYYIPYALQLAAARLSIIFWTLVGASVVVPPTAFALVRAFGGVGGAASSAILTLGVLVVMMPLMHRRLLPGENRRWLLQDVGLPILGSLPGMGFGYFATFMSASRVGQGARLTTAGLCSLLGAVMLSRDVRVPLLNRLRLLSRS